MSGKMGFDILKGTSFLYPNISHMHSHMTCFTAHHWSVLDVSCFARQQEWTEAVLQHNGNIEHLFEQDARCFGQNQLYCILY